jgi:hypothetical protein
MAKAIDTMKKSESVINRRALLGHGQSQQLQLRRPYHRQSRKAGVHPQRSRSPNAGTDLMSLDELGSWIDGRVPPART